MKNNYKNWRVAAVAAFMLLPFAANAQAITFGLYVAGEQVTTDNSANITSEYISAFDNTKPHSVTYDNSTKTLTLTNVDIDVKVQDYVIRNENINGLKIVLVGENHLFTYDETVLSIEASTTFTSKLAEGGTTMDMTYISSYASQGISVDGTNVSLTFDGAMMSVYSSETVAIRSSFDNNTLAIKNSVLKWEVDEHVSYEMSPNMNIVSGFSGFKSLDVVNSYVCMPGFNDLSEITFGNGMTPFRFDGSKYLKFNEYAERKLPVTMCEDKIVFAKAVAVERKGYYFSDSFFRKKLESFQNDSISAPYLLLPIIHDDVYMTNGDVPKDLDLSGLQMEFTYGIEEFPYLTSLDLSRNYYMESLGDLSMMNSLETVKCFGDNIRGGGVDMLSRSLPDRNGKPMAGKCYFKSKNFGDNNELTAEQIKAVKKLNWEVLYDDDTEYLGQEATGIDNVTTSAADTAAPMYNLSGQRVGKDYKGVVIQNGKKRINR